MFTCRSCLGRHSSDDARGCICSRGGGQGGRGGEHAFVGGGHAFGGFTGRGFSPGFSRTRGFSTGRFSGREDHGRFGDRGFRDHRVFFQQFAWPVYWSPYYPYDYSYLDYGPDNDYQFGDNSAPSVQPESFRPAVDHGPVVVSINAGNSRPMDSRANTEYINSGYSSSDAAGQQRIGMQDPNEKLDREPIQGPSFLRRSGNRLRRLQKALRQGHKHRSGPW